VNDRVQQRTLRIDHDVPLLAADLLACVIPFRIHASAALFRAFHALRIDGAVPRTGLPILLFAAFLIEFVMDSPPRSVPSSASRETAAYGAA
jgi:hypothetical protein